MIDPRYTALQVLVKWHRSPHTLDSVLQHFDLSIQKLSKKDRKLFNIIVFGVLRNRARIDFYIQAFSQIPFNKIKQFELYLLRIALFQIVFLDRVPDFAAVDSIVTIAKKTLHKHAAGFINAVLRTAAKKHFTLPFPDRKSEPEKFFSIYYSMPLWLARRWIRSYGYTTASILCEKINQPPDITIRVNTLKAEKKLLIDKLRQVAKNVSLTPVAREGVSFSHPKSAIEAFETFKKGWFQVQDEAAQIVSEYLSPKPFDTVLDACAGFGGKTLHMAQLMENKGQIFAVDTQSAKLEALIQDAKRTGTDIIQTRCLDILNTAIKDFPFYFDKVLLDAPCTGLGVLRRNPDAKWKKNKNDILRLAAQQKKMLNTCANLVKKGGILVYSVCSCEYEENESVIHQFLNKRKDFSIKNSSWPESLITETGFVKTYPNCDNMDGFFAAKLRRKSCL